MKNFKPLYVLLCLLLPLSLVACGGGNNAADDAMEADTGTAATGGEVGAGGRDQIRVVGSSTVYPFTTRVAEQFSRTTDFKAPVVESTGTGGGFKLFCAGVGVSHPDVSNASRAIKDSEVEMCKGNGVEEIVEVNIGYDGIVVANAKGSSAYDLSRKDLFLALAREVANDAGEIVPNPHQTWQDVNPSLPAIKIEVLGPPPTSGTRDAFVELVMETGCEEVEAVAALEETDEDRFGEVCKAIREDGAYVEAGENDNLIVQKLVANPNALGIFGYSFLEENLDKLQGSLIDGVEPTFDNIAGQTYPVSRPLFIYIKKAHVGVIPGMQEFVDEFVSDAAAGEDGYLTDVGLIPLPPTERATVRGDANTMTPNVG